MKKLLSILGVITLTGTSTTSLVACNTAEYTKEELKKEKEKNNIKTKDGILESIAPQEKPFDTVDNKWYVVIWRGDENDDWRIIKFKNDEYISINAKKIIDNSNLYNYKLVLSHFLTYTTLCLWKQGPVIGAYWTNDTPSYDYFKAVYRWDGQNEPPVLKINSDGEIEN